MNELIKRKSFFEPFFDSVSLMEKQFSELFNEPFFNDTFKGRIGRSGTLPKLNVKETNEKFVVEASVPGIKKDELDIMLYDDRLVIKGHIIKSKSDNEEKYLYRELSKRDFTRVIPFNKGILVDKASVNLQDGLLLVNIPKKEQEKVSKGKKLKL